MSSMNLNLLPSKAKFEASRIKLKHNINMAIVVVVAVWLAGAMVVLGLNVYATFRVNAASSQLQKNKESYIALADNIVTSQRLKYKAKAVGGVLSNRFEYGMAFERVKNLFPESITLRDYNLREDGVFSIDGTAQTKESIESIEKTIIDINSKKNKGMISAALTSLMLKNNDWTFRMEVVLK